MLCANAGLTIDDVFVVDRMVDFEVPYITYRDTSLSKELMLDEISDYCPAEKMDAEDPLHYVYLRFHRKSERNPAYHRRLYDLYLYNLQVYL